jgi:leucyl-tRNA synthetase
MAPTGGMQTPTQTPALQLYRQGQHSLPHHHLAGHVDRLQPRATRHLNLPYDVPANEYLNLHGGKFSTSRGNVIGWNTVLAEFQADAWRYVLTAMAPETADVEFTWQDFMDRINNELVANWGNLVNRMLGFAYKRFEGACRNRAQLDEADRAFLDEIRAGFRQRGRALSGGQAQGRAAGSAPPLAARQPVSQRARAVEDDRARPPARGDLPSMWHCRPSTGSS